MTNCVYCDAKSIFSTCMECSKILFIEFEKSSNFDPIKDNEYEWKKFLENKIDNVIISRKREKQLEKIL